jgi:hypothetical protein
MKTAMLGLTLACAMSGLAWGSVANAQAGRHDETPIPGDSYVTNDEDGYRIDFDDDPLDALDRNTFVARIQVRAGRTRELLIRPRTSFVTEMLKTVESL